MLRTFVSALFFYAAWTCAADGGVITVDSSGAGNFTAIQPAVDAAANGDVIVVAAGDYSTVAGIAQPAGAIVDSKSLTLVASPPGSKAKVSWLRITNLAAAQRVIVRGFDVVGIATVGAIGGAEALSCAGAVVLEDCSLTGAGGFLFFHSVTPGRAGMKLTNVASATFSHCALTGGNGVPGQSQFGYSPGDGGAGLEIANASVAMHESTATGGVNWPITSSQAGAAGPGAQLGPGKLVTMGASLTGGSALQANHGQGGAGLLVTASSAAAWLTDTVATGGASVSGPAPAISNPAFGAVFVVPGLSRSLHVTSPVHPGDPVAVDLAGAQNDLVLFFISAGGGFFAIDGLQGVLTMGLPAQGAFVLASITAPSGQANFVVPAPSLVPGVAGFTFVLHSIFVNGPDASAGSPTAFTLTL